MPRVCFFFFKSPQGLLLEEFQFNTQLIQCLDIRQKADRHCALTFWCQNIGWSWQSWLLLPLPSPTIGNDGITVSLERYETGEEDPLQKNPFLSLWESVLARK